MNLETTAISEIEEHELQEISKEEVNLVYGGTSITYHGGVTCYHGSSYSACVARNGHTEYFMN